MTVVLGSGIPLKTSLFSPYMIISSATRVAYLVFQEILYVEGGVGVGVEVVDVVGVGGGVSLLIMTLSVFLVPRPDRVLVRVTVNG